MQMNSRWLYPVLAAAALVAGPARAQDTIQVQLNPIANQFDQGVANIAPSLNLTQGPDGPALQTFQPISWVEWRVTCNTPGLYKIDVTASNYQDPNTVLSFETVPAAEGSSIFASRYGSPDTKDYGTFTTAEWEWKDLGIMQDVGGNDITVPLWQGDNLLRVQNVTHRHNAATSYPPDLSSPTDRPAIPVAGGWGWCNLRIGRIVLTRVGDLPKFGTISGKVQGNKPAGVGVDRAIVTANEPGKSSTEITTFWKNGYYTFTHPDGTYSLKAPVGSRDVMAGRPSGYELPGSPIINVSVTDGGTATANPQLTSLFHTDINGDTVAYVQNEYYDFINANLSFLTTNGAENAYLLGYVGDGSAVTSIVDAPQTGLYKVTVVCDGPAAVTVRVSTDLGSTTQDTWTPATGWNPVSRHDMPQTIYLQAGTNVVTETKLSGAYDFDALHLTLTSDVPTVGQVKGKVTDTITGQPVAGATVTLGTSSVMTNELGDYNMIATPGSGQTITVTHPYQDAPTTGTVNVTAGSVATADLKITVRPHVDLTTANGFNWKAIPNTGSAADFSAVAADETAALPITVPGSWDALQNNVSNMDAIFGWYRLRFTLPADFLTKLPGRMVTLLIPGVDDVDATYVNGTFIGQTGSFPTGTYAPREAGYSVFTANMPDTADPGLIPQWNTQRRYTFPASLLTSGENVLAMRVYDWEYAGGITTTPTLVIAPAAADVSGTVKAGGLAVPNARVTAMDLNGVASAWTWTDANGAFTLKGVTAGSTVLGVAKPGFTTAIKAIGVGSTPITDVALTVDAVSGGPAPSYDEFNATSSADLTWWENKWVAQSELDPTAAPFISEPGMDVNDPNMATIPGSLTVEGGIRERAALISKARFNKFASVNAARIVSALPSAEPPNGPLPNLIFQLYAPPTDDNTTWVYDYNIELDLEGYVSVDGQNRVRVMAWANFVNVTTAQVPIPLATMADITPANPVDLSICRTGTVYDFYVNDKLAFQANLPILSALPDHKIALYSYATTSAFTADWVKAGPMVSTTPVKGDMNHNGLLDPGDVIAALRIGAGLSTSTADDLTTGNVAGDANITILDAARLAQALNGRAL